MNTFVVAQGDSLWLDVVWNDLSLIDNVKGNWKAKFQLTSTTDNTAVFTGDLLDSATLGTFYLRLGPTSTSDVPVANWVDVPVGTYILAGEVNNISVDYRQESVAKVRIISQSVAG